MPDIPNQLPILSLRNTVLFPYQVQPLAVGRKKSLKLLKQLDASTKLLGLVTQRDGNKEDPGEDDMYSFGIVATIVKSFKMPDGSEHIIIQGMERIRIKRYIQTDPHMIAEIEVVKSEIDKPVHIEALVNNCKNLFAQIVEISAILSNEHLVTVKSEKNPGVIADIIASNLNMSVEEKQEILEIISVKDRLEKVHLILNKEIQVLELENKIQTDVQGELNKNQREFVLKEQLKAIRRELGEADDELDDLDELKEKIKNAKVPSHVEKVVKKEFKRLSQMNQMAGEYSVVRNYLEWISDIPWSKKSKDRIDLKVAQKTMDDDHYGLETVKKRIIEFLAVKKIKSDLKGPILCLYGPPGVGKTSLGRSIAKSLNREFGRISLGGISDEAEIRGHRRTYIGAMPGRIVRELKKLEVKNPVIMLDEIDKIGKDFKGDPSSALLEVLDPEQNNTFVDNYIEVEIDLSQVLFIATANRLDTIPAPLLDRMEVIDISGYIEEEKISIAENYLIPKQLKAHGLENKKMKFHKSAISMIINSYTKEAGVRGLEKAIASVVRYIATEYVMTKKIESVISKKIVETSLGKPKYESEVKERTSRAGVATGMAWTPYGGEILFIEAT
ncbi:MAG: endopeptidase La, partial [Calditrichaeota bacterium]|nr:endopeptidase La [Calditrichota bacterium]